MKASWKVLFAIFLAIPMAHCMAAAGKVVETKKLRVFGEIHYRCYPKGGASDVVDERTGLACQNKSMSEVVVDKTVSFQLEVRSNPGGSLDADGVWSEQFEHMGRKYTLSVLISKSPSPVNYSLRIVAVDDEPVSRHTAVYAKAKRFSELNPLQVELSSVGKKEEVKFIALVEPGK